MRHKIGTNAGIVWRAVAAKNGRMTFEELLEVTGLTKSQTLLSLGWLEREGNVSLHGDNGMINLITLYHLYQEKYY